MVSRCQVEIHGRPRIITSSHATGGAGDDARVYTGPPQTYTFLPDPAGVRDERDPRRIHPRLTFDPVDGVKIVLRWTIRGVTGEEKQIRHEFSHPVTLYRVADSAQGGRPALRAVVRMPVEEYLLVVLPSEMGADWPMEALKAQAVAARTYVWHSLRTRPNSEYHVTTGDMEWDPAKARNSPSVRQAVMETAGVVMLEKHKTFPAYFHSECGGVTVDARLALDFQKDFHAALAGVRCMRCAALPRDRMKTKADFAISLDEITRRLRQGGVLRPDEDLRRFTVHANRVRTGPGGQAVLEPGDALSANQAARVAWMVLHTSQGAKNVLASTFRRLMGGWRRDQLTSTYMRVVPPGADGRFHFETQGWGHGAGLCQYGADHAARSGLHHQAILQWYYPGVQFFRVYGNPAN